MPVLAAEADVALTFAMRHTFKVGRTKVGGRGVYFWILWKFFLYKRKITIAGSFFLVG
jgi:hypothetical protein